LNNVWSKTFVSQLPCLLRLFKNG